MEETSDPDAVLENESRRTRFVESMTVVIVTTVAWLLVYVVPMNGIHPLFSLASIIPAFAAALVGVYAQIRAYWEMVLRAFDTRDALLVILALTTPTILLTVQLFTGITTFLWSRGILHSAPSRSPEFWAAEKYYAWHVMDAIPLLEIAKNFNWEPPVRFTDHLSGGLLLGFKVLLIFPLLGVIAATYRVFQDYWSTQLTNNAQEPRFSADLRTAGERTRDAVESMVSATFRCAVAVIYPTLMYLVLTTTLSRSSPIGRWAPTALQIAIVILLVLLATYFRMRTRHPIAVIYRVTSGSRAALITSIFFRIRTLIMTMLAACAVTLLLLHVGIAETAPLRPQWNEELGAVIGWYAWRLAETVPTLKIPQTLNWTIQFEFTDVWSRIFLLALKVNLLFTILFPVLLLLKLYKESHPRFKLTEEIPFYEKALADYEKHLGHDHRSTLIARFELACAYVTIERVSEAVPLLEDALAGFERIFGSDHEETVDVRRNLEIARKLLAT